jgi:L-malate glycosyltransferase
MKIAIVSTMQIYPWGGSEELWFHTALKALEQGHAVDCYVYKHNPKPTKHQALEANGVNVCYVPIIKGRFASIIKNIQSLLPNPYRALLLGNYDHIIISQGGTFELFNQPLLLNILNKFEGEKITIVSHGNQNGLLLPAKQRNLARQFFTKVKQACFISNWAIQLTESQILHRLPNAKIVFNPFKQITDQPLTVLSAKLRMAMVSSLSVQWKGHDLILNLLAGDPWKNRDWQLEIYGNGPDKEYLTDLIVFYGLQNKVTLMGHVNEVSNIWNQNTILLAPSRVDNVPITLLEAMACARTAVVTDVGGMTEWIDDTIGFVAKGPSTAALSQAMEKMWLNKELLTYLGQQCQKRVKQKMQNKHFDLLHLL